MRYGMLGEGYEDRNYCETAGVRRRTAGISAVRRRRTTNSFRATLHACATRTSIQKEVGSESKQTRTQAQGQPFGLGPRLPRHALVDRFCFRDLASEFRIGQSLADYLTHADIKAFGVVHLSVVESPSRFVYVSEQVERFHTDVGPVQAALKQRPKVFHPVGMNVLIHVLDRMVDDCVLVVSFQPIIRVTTYLAHTVLVE